MADPFRKLLTLLDRLDRAKVPYQIRHSRDDAIMVIAFAPGQYWEIDIMQDGEVEIERYRSNGNIDDDSVLEELFDRWAEDEVPTEPTENANDAIARP